MKGGRYLEDRHVKKVYDTIAPSFNDIPQKVWPNVKKFIKSLTPGSLVADIGCGNGRYLHINKSVFKFGVDVCFPLVELSREKGYEVLVADNQTLPFKDGAFDAVISVGVLHHFSTEERRIQALKELSRVLRPGGKLLVYVWAYEQKHRKFDGQDVLVPWHAGKKTTQTGRFSSDQNISSSVRDLSSTSSVSEDDSNENSIPRHYIQRTNSDPSCPSHPAQPSLLSKLLNSSTKSFTPRQRSNTLPSSLEAFSDVHHGNSEIEEECRKLQISLREMAASHDHLSASNDSIFCLDTNDSNDRDDDEHGITFESKCFDEENIVTNDYNDIGNDLVLEKGEISKNIVSSSLFPDFDVNCNQNIKDQKEEVKKTKKLSLFESLKRRFLKFIDSQESDDLSQNKVFDGSIEVQEKQKCLINDGSPLLQDINLLGCFAVREFPMSSCPDYRQKVQDPLFNEKQNQICTNNHHNCQENIDNHEVSANSEKKSTSLDSNEHGLKTRSKQLSYSGLNSRKQISTERHKSVCDGCTEKKSEKSYCTTEPFSNGYNEPELNTTKTQYLNQSSTSKCKSLTGNSDKSLRTGCSNNTSRKKTGIKKNSGNFNFETDNCVKNANKETAFNGYPEKCFQKDLHRSQSQTTYNSISTNRHTSKVQSGIENFSPKNDRKDTVINRSYKDNRPGKHDTASITGSESCLFENGFSTTINVLKDKNSKVHGNNQNHIKTCSENISSSQNSLSIYNPQSFTSYNNGADFVPSPCSTIAFDEFQMSPARLCRYYHVFREGELSTLIHDHIDDLTVISCIYDHGNWCLTAEKLGAV